MANEARQTVPDSRPRAAYVLPDGTEVAIIFDHGEHQPQSVTYELGDGRVVYATKKPPPNPHEHLARLRKRDRIVAAIVIQAQMQPLFTWTQIADFVETLDEHKRTAFALGIGEKRAPSGETWTLVVAVLRSWADSDARVLASEARR